MAQYSYKLVTKENKLVGGSISAYSKSEAARTLAQDGSTVLFVSRLGGRKIELPSLGFSKLERIDFFRDLATMLISGMSLVSALDIASHQIKNKRVRAAVSKIGEEVLNGQKLSSAMRQFPKYFPQYLTETIAVGEHTGRLSTTLERISVDLEEDYELTRRVKAAMAYPAIVVIVMVAVLIAMMVYVLPQIADLFRELEAPLPLPTMLLLGMSTFIRSHPILIILALAVLIALGFAIRKNNQTRSWLHKIILRLPLFGPLTKEFNLARFFRSLETLYSGGVSLVQSVEIAKKTLSNLSYRQAFDQVEPILLHGVTLSETLKPFPFLFPEQTVRIIEVGEHSGKLSEIFTRITVYYERVVKHKTQIFASLIEPILIILIGLALGGLAVSIFLPIYQVSTVL